jgi:hypothetical protein
MGQLLGALIEIDEGFTLAHLSVGIVWAAYILAGIVFVLMGDVGLIVIGNMAIAISAGLFLIYKIR